MSEYPLVTIVVPVFNAEEWLNETLASIEHQEMGSWELIVVDDSSSDNGVELVSSFAETVPQDVRVIQISKSGPSAARNVGIQHARGRYIAFLDADDLWDPTKLKDQVDFLTNDDAAIGVICDYAVSSVLGGGITHIRHFEWGAHSLMAWALMESYGPCLNSTLCVRRSVLQTIGGFRREMTNIEDLDLAYRLDQHGAILNTGRTQMTYRLHPGQNHRDSDTILRDYRIFLRQWHLVPQQAIRRGHANALLLEALRSWSQGHHFEAVRYCTQSIRLSPVQWLRVLKGMYLRK